MINQTLVVSVCRSMAEEIRSLFGDISTAEVATLGVAADKYSRTASAVNLAAVERMAKTIADSVNRFCGKAHAPRAATDSDVPATVRAAFAALTRHVKDVGDGRKVTPLSMGSSYARLIELYGDRIPLPGEFFLPYIPDTGSWCKVSAAPVDDAAFTGEMAKTRAAFEKAFLAFHKTKQSDFIVEMRRLLLSLQVKNPHQELALFLEAAVTAMECIDPDEVMQDDYGVLMRIDIELGWLIKSKGVMEPDGYLVSALLYHVARKARRSVRAARLCQKLQLGRYLDFSDEHLLVIYEKFMAAMPKIQEAWSKVPDPTFMSAFGKMLSQIVSHGGALRNFQFIAVAKGIDALFGKLFSGTIQFSEVIAIEIAFDLILLEEMLDSDTHEREAGQWRVDAAVDRLNRLALNQEIDSSAVGITEKQRIQAMSSACAQLKSEIEALEDALIKANDDESADMGTIRRLFTKMNGVFFALGLDDAMALLRKASKMVDMFLVMDDDEKTSLAEIVAFIGMYVNYLADGNSESALEVMTKARELFLADQEHVAPDIAANVSHPPAAAGEDVANDDEMLEIYLDEATGVINAIGLGLAQLGTDRQVDGLLTIRRSFHTLKGSARMVGLQRLGNVAWDVERVLNRYIAHDNLVTPALVQMITDGNAFFSEKVALLKEMRRAPVDDQYMAATSAQLLAANISHAARVRSPIAKPAASLTIDLAIAEVPAVCEPATQIPTAAPIAEVIELAPVPPAAVGVTEALVDARSGEEPPLAQVLAPTAPADRGDEPGTTAPDAGATSGDDLMDDDKQPVGLTARLGGYSVTVEAWLYDLYIKEMEKLIVRMNDGLDVLRSSGVVVHDMMRAIHTCASNSATAGFPEVYNLAHALEMLVAPHVDKPMTYVNEDASLIETAIRAIESAYGLVLNRVLPDASPDIVARLDAEISAGAQQDISVSGAPGNYDLGMENMETTESAHGEATEVSGVSDAEASVRHLDSDEPGAPEDARDATAAPVVDSIASNDLGAIEPTPVAPISAGEFEIAELPPSSISAAVALELPPIDPVIDEWMVALEATSNELPIVVADEPDSAAPDMGSNGKASAAANETGLNTPMGWQEQEPEREAFATAESTGMELPDPGLVGSLDDLSFDLPAEGLDEPGEVSDRGGSHTATVSFSTPTIPSGVEDDIDAALLPVFLEESGHIMGNMPEWLRRWVDEDDKVAMREILRASHTMKGSARMTGMMRFGALMHSLESMLDSVRKVHRDALPSLKAAVESGYDLAALLIDRYRANDDVSGICSLDDARGVVVSAPDAPQAVEDRRAHPGDTVLFEDRRAPIGRKTVQIPVTRLDSMELSIAESLLALSKTEGFTAAGRENEERLRDNIKRMSSLMRQLTIHMDAQMEAGSKVLSKLTVKGNWDSLEMDRFTRAQELTRMINECAADLGETMNDVDSALGLIMDSVLDQGRHIDDLQHEIIQSRLVSFRSLDGRLMRVLRSACRDTGKKASLEFDADIDVDSSILEKLIAPMEHILRNSIAHGIESPAERVAANKPEAGIVRISARIVGAEIQIKVADDGTGIDREKLVAKARAQGLVASGLVVADDFADNLAFHPGLSTADTVSELAGRGVGLDAVKGAVDALGGDVTVQSKSGRGCVFTLHAPMSASTIQAVPVSVNGHRYIIPTTLIESIVTMDGAAITKAYQDNSLPVPNDAGSRVHPFVSLGRVLELQAAEAVEVKRNNTVIVMHDEGTMPGAAIHVEGTAPFRKYVVRHLPCAPAGVMGGTIDERGNVAPIINPVVMMRQVGSTSTSQVWSRSLTATTLPKDAKVAPMVMIVDDSITVRKVTEAALKKHNFRVMHAKDGMEAWEILHDIQPDIILLDIEMPRMTGFELMELIRNSGNHAILNLPVIMISSRGAEKHVKHAYRLGVNSYQVKPFDTDTLISEIHQLLSNKGGARAAA